MRRILVVICCALLCSPLAALAQTLTVSGRVTSEDGAPLGGVRVEEVGTASATVTDADGSYTFRYSSANASLRFSRPGYNVVERAPAGAPTLNVTLERGVAVEGLTVVGSRRQDRSAVSTPVPVDVIHLAGLTPAAPRTDLNQILQYVAPSFNSNRQSGADGSDHIDPAALRGLGPDQTLVLINGKRRHQSSLINIFGSRGRGNTGTDLNAIPVSAIDRVEILRDGASAQYGSDAIAGVINVVLKSGTDGLEGSVSAGAHNARPSGNARVLRESELDGEEVTFGSTYGVRLGETGFLDATAEYVAKGRTNRPADPGDFPDGIYRRQFGDAEADNFGLFLNSRVPVTSTVALYGFGGVNLRQTDAYAWTRDPDSDRNVPAIYPNGFDPRILSDITDRSLTAGVQTRLKGWSVDAYNTYGANRFHYIVDGTLNASLLERSPTRFDAGGFDFSQNTTGLSFTQFFPGPAEGVNVAFGAEYRIDRYRIFAGEEASWRNYGVVDSIIDGRVVPVDVLGRPGGAQGFPGFRPENELDEVRTNLGVFADAEMDVTSRLMVGAAARYEAYSDFGNTLTGKVAARFTVSPALTLRGSFSTGFRAPSLAQVYFNSTFTDFVGGEPVDKIIARNGSPITRALGIPALTEEKATNATLGFTLRSGGFLATVDGYRVDIDDRIVLTGAFDTDDPDIGDELEALGVGAAQFFTNALDTRTLGVDVVLSYGRTFGRHRVRASFAGNFNDMELGAVRTSPRLAGKEDVYFGPREQAFLLASAPPSKLTFSLDHGVGNVELSARANRFGRVTLIDWIDTPDVYHSRTTADAALTYRLPGGMSFTVGGTNLFNAYPSPQDTETETGGVWDAVQMGFSGAYYFARLNFRL
jgi:iron complex outermembrane recepter protein